MKAIPAKAIENPTASSKQAAIHAFHLDQEKTRLRNTSPEHLAAANASTKAKEALEGSLGAKLALQRENDALMECGQRVESYEEEIDRIIWQEKSKGSYHEDLSGQKGEADSIGNSVFMDQVVLEVKNFLEEPSWTNSLGLSVALTQSARHTTLDVNTLKEKLQAELSKCEDIYYDENDDEEENHDENETDMDSLPPCMLKINRSGEDLITKLSACDWALLGIKPKTATINFNVALHGDFPDVKRGLEWKKKLFKRKANFCTQTVRILHNAPSIALMPRQLVLQSAVGILKGNTISFAIDEAVYVIKALIDATLDGMKLQAQAMYEKEKSGNTEFPMTAEKVLERHAARLAYLEKFF